jgi:hypothetical protein
MRPRVVNLTAMGSGHRVQSISPMPQVHHSPIARPISHSPPPFRPTPFQASSPSFEDPLHSGPGLGSQPTSVPLLARGISLLSITQLRELLREYSLPTGGNKQGLVNRLVIFLETFGQTQPNLVNQFSGKLKALLAVDPEEPPRVADCGFGPPAAETAPEAARVSIASPSCLFEATDAAIPFGPLLIQIPQMLGYQHPFTLPLPPGEVVPILQFAPVPPGVPIRKLSIQIGGVFTTFVDSVLWLDVREFVNRQAVVQLLQIDPAVSVVAFIRWMQRVPLPDLAQRILSEREFAVPRGHARTRPNGVCPLTRKLIARPARGVKCQHDDCFDLTGFLSYAMKTNSWACPICHMRLVAEDLRVDPNYFRQALPRP